MAFNPFDSFRKRSKTIFAVVGIVVMFTFVLSAGTGGQTDFFHQIGNFFGRGPRGTTVAEAFGENIPITELDEIRRQRLAANSFMSLAKNASYMNLAKEIRKDLQGDRFSKETKAAIDRFIELKVESTKNGEEFEKYSTYLRQMFNGPAAQLMARARQAVKPDSEDAKVLDSVQEITFHDLFGFNRPFFTTVGGDSTKDLLDFDLLLKKAERSGIEFSPDAVRELFMRDIGGRFTKRDNGEIEATLRKSGRFPNFSGDWLMNAVANEYKARAMLVSLQGNQSSISPMFSRGDSQTVSALPGAVTPNEFYQFYQDRCREVNFTLVEIPTESFVASVKETPTAKDLNQLFMKYRGDESDPAKDTPGFKESRKVMIDFVTVDSKAARISDGIKPLTAVSQFLSGIAGAQLPGGGVAAPLMQAVHPHLAETLPVMRELEIRRAQANNKIEPGEQFFFRPRDTSVYRAEPLVSFLGSLAAGSPDLTKFSAAHALMIRNIEIEHLKTITPIVLQSWLAPFNATPANAFGWPALGYALNPKPLPDAVYLKEVLATLKKDQLHRIFEKDCDEFRNRMNEAARDLFGISPDKSKAEAAKKAAAKYATEWATARKLPITGTKAPVTKKSILTDPALKPLVDAAKNDVLKDPAEAENTLVSKFFDAFPQQIPGMPPTMQTMMFDPEFFPNRSPFGAELDKPQLLVWLSDEISPVSYNSLEAANKATNGETGKLVEAAWKFEKAKELAKKQAEKLATEVTTIAKEITTNKPAVEKKLNEIPYRKINADGLAKLKFQHSATQASISYDSSKLTKGQVEYPTPDFVEKLLEQRNKPLGTVLVLNDVPRAKYYVAVSTGKTERTVEQFRDVFAKVNATGVGQNPLYSQFALSEQRQKEARDAFVRLRAEANLKENEEFAKMQKKEAEQE